MGTRAMCIVDGHGNILSDGLDCVTVSDAATRAAVEAANDQGVSVWLCYSGPFQEEDTGPYSGEGLEVAPTSRDYQGYDTVTEWHGTPRKSLEQAQKDVKRHNRSMAAQGGFGSAIVGVRKGKRLTTLDGRPIWPPHGRSTGSVRWRP